MAVKELRGYSVMIYSRDNAMSVRIQLNCEDSYVLGADFSVDPQAPNAWDEQRKAGNIKQPLAAYEHYLDLLRNEKPIDINFMTNRTPPEFIVMARGEEVGEEET